jgi:hypothetical protein
MSVNEIENLIASWEADLSAFFVIWNFINILNKIFVIIKYET